MYDSNSGSLNEISLDEARKALAEGNDDKLFTVGEIVAVKGGFFRITKLLGRNRMMLKSVKKEASDEA